LFIKLNAKSPIINNTKNAIIVPLEELVLFREMQYEKYPKVYAFIIVLFGNEEATPSSSPNSMKESLHTECLFSGVVKKSGILLETRPQLRNIVIISPDKNIIPLTSCINTDIIAIDDIIINGDSATNKYRNEYRFHISSLYYRKIFVIQKCA
jgi:hypothetical protein